MAFHTLHSHLSREEVKTLVCMTHFAKCLVEKDIDSLKSVWQPSSPAFCLCQSLVSPSSACWPLSTPPLLQSADVRPGPFQTRPNNEKVAAGNPKWICLCNTLFFTRPINVWEREVGNPKEEL